MDSVYLLAMITAILCLGIISVAWCRTNASDGKVLMRIRIMYALYAVGALVMAIGPLYGHWPGLGAVMFCACVFGALLCDMYQWRLGPPPGVQSDHCDLRTSDGSHA